MARPKREINEKQVYELAKMGASNVDIAQVMNCSEGTIRARFYDLVTLARAERRNSLHTWQWKAAEKGSEKMLIWLGKQVLGQTDKIETKNEIRSVVDRDEQHEMLTTEETLDLACKLDQAIIRAGRASRDDPGRLRPSRQ